MSHALDLYTWCIFVIPLANHLYGSQLACLDKLMPRTPELHSPLLSCDPKLPQSSLADGLRENWFRLPADDAPRGASWPIKPGDKDNFHTILNSSFVEILIDYSSCSVSLHHKYHATNPNISPAALRQDWDN